MTLEPTALSDTSTDVLALLAALDPQAFQQQVHAAVTAQQQRAHTLGLQQETQAQVQDTRVCCWLTRDGS